MSYRGPAIQYKIRKTTTNNSTGDNFSITVPRVIAEKFEECLFKISISGNSIVFTSGCKLTIQDINNPETKKIIVGDSVVSFR